MMAFFNVFFGRESRLHVLNWVVYGGQSDFCQDAASEVAKSHLDAAAETLRSMEELFVHGAAWCL